MDVPNRHDLRTSYDEIAGEYAENLSDELENKPFDRALLARFADKVIGTGSVCDLGCGPGHVARYLSDLGVEVFGVDLSSGMAEEARRLNPEIDFRQGDMLSLDFADDSCGGVVAFYSVVHLTHRELTTALTEIYRTLRPGGSLLISFHVGEEVRHLDEMWGRKVSLDFHFFLTEDVEHLLADAGFEVEEALERPPYEEHVEVQTRRAYILAKKPVS